MTYDEFKKLITTMEQPEETRQTREMFANDLLSYENIRSRIFYRVIAVRGNEDLLERCPFIPFFDMAVTFRWLMNESKEGISSAMIETKHLKYWEMTEEDIIREAVKNTPVLFPARRCEIWEILRQWLDDREPHVPLYVLTNRIGINGASAMFYRDELEKFGKKQKQGFYILPSSIHEVLFLAEEYVSDVQALYQMVWDANHTVVDAKDILSNQVLYYNIRNHEIEAADKRK